MKSAYIHTITGKETVLDYGIIYTKEDIIKGLLDSVEGIDWNRAENSVYRLYKAGKFVKANGKKNQYMLVK